MARRAISIQTKFLLGIAIVIFPTLGFLFLWEGIHNEKQVMEQVKMQAMALSRQIILTRQWISDCGGVMVPRNSAGVGNTAFFYDQRLQTSQGVLQRFTPSMVTKKLSQYSLKEDLYQFRLVSLNPMNPENRPNRFEATALNHFKAHNAREMYEIQNTSKKEYFHYIVPLYMDHTCLGCHNQNNLSKGAIGGGLSVVLPVEKIKTSLSKNRWRRGIAGAGIFLLMSFTLFFILRRVIISPLRELEEMTSEISRGNLSVRVDIATGDEFEELGRDFNTMAQKLSEGRHSLEEKISQATRELSEANQELQTLGKLKTDFLANMSHELRSPLTVLRGGIDYLNRTIKIEDNRNYLQIIDKNLARLIRLVTDMFDFTKLEANKTEWVFEEEDLVSLIREVVEIISPLALEKNVALAFDSAEKVMLAFDLERIEQVLVNLIDNAIKFSDPGTEIIIRVTGVAETVTVSIKNNGAGIAKGHLGSIFDKFSTVPSGINSKTEGTGLGLAICKAIIEAHNGKIWAESVQGASTTVFFTLPRRQNRLLDG